MSALKRLPHSRFIAVIMLMLLMLSLFITFINADVGKLQVEWQQFLPGISGEAVVQTSDGGFLALGTNATLYTEADSGETKYANTTHLLIKTARDGSIVWTKTLPVTEPDFLNIMIKTSDGGYALGGGKFVTLPWHVTPDFVLNESMRQLFLLKVDSMGNAQWSGIYQNYDGEGLGQSAYLKSLIQTNDGGFALAGSYSEQGRIPRIWFVKTDNSGNLQWNKTIRSEEPNERAGGLSAVTQTSDGGYMIIGSSYIPGDGRSVENIKIDANGNTQWIKKYPGLTYDNSPECNCAIPTNDGYLIGGSIRYEEYYGWLAKVDSLGNPVWNRTYLEPYGQIYSVAQIGEDGYFFAGVTGKNSSYGGNAVIFKIDSEGNVKGQVKFEPEPSLSHYSTNQPNQIAVTDEGGCILVGTWNSTIPLSSGFEKFWLVKIAPTPTPSQEPTLVPEQLETIVGAAIAVAIIGAGLGLLSYLIKRK